MRSSLQSRPTRRHCRVRGLIAAIVAVGIPGCSTVLGIDANRSVVSETLDAGAWDCLGAPSEALDPSRQVELTLLVMDALQSSTAAGAIDGGSDLDTVSGVWLPGVAVQGCALRDLNCESGSTSVVTTNSAGAATFSLTQDFAGYFEMRRSDLVPATLYPGNLLVGQPVASFPAYDISPAGLRDLASTITPEAIGLDPAGNVGHAIVTVYDCLDHQAPLVSVTYSTSAPSTVPYYFADGLPSSTATMTDSYGLAGAVNLPIGSMTVTAALPSSKTPVGMTAFLVRPGALTFAWIRARTH
jgi:hypothetical protein